MAQVEWSEAELAAAVDTYLQMLHLEQRGDKYNKAQFERALLTGPLKGRSTTQQRMQNISWVLQSLERPWIPGFKPLGNIGKNVPILERLLRNQLSGAAAPLPVYAAVQPSTPRELPATGYWILVCNPTQWDAERWLRFGEVNLLYKVSKHNRDEVNIGDLAALRMNAHAGRPSRVVALLEVTGVPVEQADPDDRAYVADSGSEVRWRASFRLIANLVDGPIATSDLPHTEAFKHLHTALQTSSIPMPREAFVRLWQLAGVRAEDVAAERLAETNEGVGELERQAQSEDPVRKERISKYIERGAIGAAVKAALGNKCQVCEALGNHPVAFLKRSGEPYAEAHHVQPVALLIKGSLGASNIMVLCPNHHRQAHYGDLEIESYEDACWRLRLDGQKLQIARGGLALSKTSH